jgi:hypothetical protein
MGVYLGSEPVAAVAVAVGRCMRRGAVMRAIMVLLCTRASVRTSFHASRNSLTPGRIQDGTCVVTARDPQAWIGIVAISLPRTMNWITDAVGRGAGKTPRTVMMAPGVPTMRWRPSMAGDCENSHVPAAHRAPCEG